MYVSGWNKKISNYLIFIEISIVNQEKFNLIFNVVFREKPVKMYYLISARYTHSYACVKILLSAHHK